MKKLVSLTLAAVMSLSLFAVGTSAAVPVKVDDVNISIAQDFEGDVAYFSKGCSKSGEVVLDGDGTVFDLDGRTQTEAAVAGLKEATSFTLRFDAKAPFASADLRLYFKNNLGNYMVVLRPGLFVPLTQQLRADFDKESAIYKGMWTNSATAESEDALVSDQWYNFVITVDNEALNNTLTVDSILKAVEVKYKKAEDAEYAVVTGNKTYTPWEATWYPMLGAICDTATCNVAFANSAEVGQQYSVWFFDKEADTITKVGDKAHYVVDNIKLDAVEVGEEFETNGVIFHEDYEGESNKLNFGKFSKTVTDESGNTYLEIDIPTTASGTEGVAKYMESNRIVAPSLPEGFIWTVDVCPLDANSVDFKLEYFSDSFGTTREKVVNGETITEPVAATHGDYAVSKAYMKVGEWFRFKLVKYPGVEKPVATVTNLTTGSRLFANAAVNREGNISGIENINRFFIRSSLYNDTRVFKWAVDNFTITELGAESLVYATKEDDTVTACINVDAGVDTKATGITVTPILALYKGDRLVDATFEKATINDYDGEQKILKASGDYDKAIILLWKSIGGTPILNTWDITDMIEDISAVPES